MKIFIENKEDAIAAAEAIFDYTDNNLSMMEATDMPKENIVMAENLYNKAKAFKEFLK